MATPHIPPFSRDPQASRTRVWVPKTWTPPQPQGAAAGGGLTNQRVGPSQTAPRQAVPGKPAGLPAATALALNTPLRRDKPQPGHPQAEAAQQPLHRASDVPLAGPADRTLQHRVFIEGTPRYDLRALFHRTSADQKLPPGKPNGVNLSWLRPR